MCGNLHVGDRGATNPKRMYNFVTCVIKSMENVLTWLFQLPILPYTISTANVHKFLHMFVIYYIGNFYWMKLISADNSKHR